MAMLLWLARALIWLLSFLPQASLNGLARLLAALTYRLPWHKNAIIDRNLSLCFPDLDEASRRSLHQRHLYELFRLVFEAPVLWHWSGEKIRSRITNETELKTILETGSETRSGQTSVARSASIGTLFVTGHFGNWELLNLSLSTNGPMTTLYRAPSHPALDRFINAPRRRFGGRMVPGDRAALKYLLQALRNGEAVGIAADIQPKRGDGLFVPFFGIDTLTMTLVHKLAGKTGCRVILIDLVRDADGRGWTQRLTDATEMMAKNDSAEALTAMNRWLEDRIRSAPEQYLWLYKRFSRRPEGEGRIYP